LSWLNDNFISRFFVTVIGWFYSLTGDYLIAVVLFTLAIKLILLPLDLKQRRAQAEQAAVSAKVKEIQNRYKSDPRVAQQKVREFYKKENIKQTAGCLPLLLQLPVLFAMFGAITLLSNSETIKLVAGLSSGQVAMPPSALWVHNIWRPDSGSAAIMPTSKEFSTLLATMKNRIPDELFFQAQELIVNGDINQVALTAARLPATTYFGGMANAALSTIPTATITQAVSTNYAFAINPVLLAYPGRANGMFIFPVLAAATTFASQWLQKKQNEKANPTAPAAMGGGMEYIMPLITLWWTSTAGVAFAMYWMANSVLSVVSIPLLNKVVGHRGGAQGQIADK
jgi:YidC/Oxa1 family membrane protein insertase